MDSQAPALTFAERARRVVEEDAKAYDLMAAKAALFDEMLEVLEEAECDLRQRARPGREWLDKAQPLIAKANTIKEVK